MKLKVEMELPLKTQPLDLKTRRINSKTRLKICLAASLALLLPLLAAPSEADAPAAAQDATAASQNTPSASQAVPVLQIETGTHTAVVTACATDQAGKIFASASEDKTVRLWDAATGKPLGVLRPPIGDAEKGRLYAVAVSPDGSTVACGGTARSSDEAVCAYLFDRSGKLLRHFLGLTGQVTALAFSQDGKYLAVGTNDDTDSLGVFRCSDAAQVGRDTQTGPVLTLDFARADEKDAPMRLAVVGHGIFLYKFLESASPPLRLVTLGQESAANALFSPNGSLVLAMKGSDNGPSVATLSGNDLSAADVFVVRPVSEDSVSQGNLQLGQICWSADGTHIYAEGQMGVGPENHAIFQWDVLHPGVPVRLPAPGEPLAGIFSRKGVGLLYADSYTPLVVMDAAGRRTRFHEIPKVRNLSRSDLLVSEDGYTVQWQAALAGSSIRFGLRDHALTAKTSPEAKTPPEAESPLLSGTGELTADAEKGLLPPVESRPALTLSYHDDPEHPKFNSEPIVLSPASECWSHAIAPDEQSFILGTSNSLQCFNQDQQQLWSRFLPDAAWKVNISRNGKVAVAAVNDGTVRWFRMTDGAELCTLYVDPDQKRWVAWTPMGHYDCSVDGEALFGWHVDHGAEQAAAFYPGSHYHPSLYRPALVVAALDSPDTLNSPDTLSSLDTPGDAPAPDKSQGDGSKPQEPSSNDAKVGTDNSGVSIDDPKPSLAASPQNSEVLPKETVSRLKWGRYQVVLEKVIKDPDDPPENYEQLRIIDAQGMTIRTIRDLYIGEVKISPLLGDSAGELCFGTSGGGRIDGGNFVAYTQKGGLHNIVFDTASVSVVLSALKGTHGYEKGTHGYGLAVRRGLAGPPELTYHEYPVVRQVYVWNGQQFSDASAQFPSSILAEATQAQADFLRSCHGKPDRITIAGSVLSALQYLADMTAIGRQKEAAAWLGLHSPASIQHWFLAHNSLVHSDMRSVQQMKKKLRTDDRTLIDEVN